MYVPHFYIDDVVASVHTIYLCWYTQLLVQTVHILKAVIVFSLEMTVACTTTSNKKFY